MNIRQIQEARELFGIDEWGAGYFGINDEGNIVCYPTGEEHLSVDLMEAVAECKEKGLKLPLIVRFPQVIEGQLERMHTAFSTAIAEYHYKGRHFGVFPYKVNQRREFIENVVSSGQSMDYGLEAGSKAELLAALSYSLSDDALLIGNGFKDAEFIELGFHGAAIGKNVILVVEGPEELEMIIQQAQKHPVCPELGLRIRLYSRGSGKWEKSSGETSKFGLTTIEVLRSLKLLEEHNLQEKLSLLHIHIGSQVTEIKRFKNAMKEISRVYAKIWKMGYKPRYLDIGGGVGVDYDGSKTSFSASANYSLQEFANDAVYVIGEVCANENVPCPHLITESGRIIAAYHSVVITDIREVQGEETITSVEEVGIEPDISSSHKGINELKYILDNINRKNFVEYYHDALEYHDELFTLFNLGYLQLEDRALVEDLFHKICRRALFYSTFHRHQLEEFEELQKLMYSKYLANFSIFQSIPDAWAIDQLFPVMPLSRHEEKPTHKATIVDITCDSDGCLERFIDRHDVKSAIDLHPRTNDPYYIGFFLVGAYQESLANEHNLFGAINSAEIHIKDNGSWEITKTTSGELIQDLLQYRNYDVRDLFESYQNQIKKSESQGLVKRGAGAKILKRLKELMKVYPYLLEN